MLQTASLSKSGILRRFGLAPLAGIAALAALAACSPSGAGGKTDVAIATGDISLGSANAPVELVEYGSLTCSHCRDFWKQVMPVVKANYVDSGKVKFTFREFPTAPAEVSIAASAVSRCAGKDKYYDVIDDVYTNQHELIEAAMAGGAGAMLVQIGGRHGVSAEQVPACINSKQIQDEIAKIGKAAPDYVQATPTLIVNGKAIEDHSVAGVSAALDAALGITPATPAPASTEVSPTTPAAPATPAPTPTGPTQ